ncbi:MAG: alpha/beta hydrolase family protein [bacterium]
MMHSSKKVYLFSLLVNILILQSLHAQIELYNTHWEGAIVRNSSVQRIEFDWKTLGDSLIGFYSIPELGLYNQAVTDIRYDHPKLSFKFIYGTFEMRVHDDNMEMTGENAKWSPPVTLHLKQAVESKRSFTIEEIQFRNKEIILAGSLFLPVGAEPCPAILIIHGSGSGSRKEWTYNFWGYFFAQQGIAALIYDKRGTGESIGDLDRASFYDLADDAIAGVEYLKSRKEIAKEHIGLSGLSQGGWLAPLAASKTKDVSFLILNVAPAVSVSKQEIDRVVYTLRAKGYPEKDVELAKEYTEKMFQVAYNYGKIDEMKSLIDSVKNKEWVDVLNLVQSEADLQDWRLEKYDPTYVLKKTTIPVYVSYGEKDNSVPPEENAILMTLLIKSPI